jgi:hypothetical protein
MFERGDRVRVNGVEYSGVNYYGAMGTVVKQDFDSTCLVEIDESREWVWFYNKVLTLCEGEPLQPGNLAGLFK